MYYTIGRDGSPRPTYEVFASYKSGNITKHLPFSYLSDALSTCNFCLEDEECVSVHVMRGADPYQAWYRLGTGAWEQRA